MYSDDDLNTAVKQGIFSETDVETFRRRIAENNASSIADEEIFKLIGGFNDIFIVIACGLLLFSSFSVLESVNVSLAYLIFAVLSWGLAEFFVLKRKMALPAIMLLIAFIGGVAGFSHSLLPLTSELGAMMAASLSAVAAYVHWQRFSVPITVAVAVAALVGLIVSLLSTIIPEIEKVLSPVLFMCGLSVFAFAMVWDSADTSRVSYRSDVAFWLHLLAAPLIIHPIFTGLDILKGDESLMNMILVVALYLLLTFVSMCIDRRVLMVSSLMYVIYALSGLIDRYGVIGSGFAFTCVLMGAMLLLLSAYWHRVRARLVSLLPMSVQNFIPKAKLI
jgi:hypothetical protein